MAKRTLRRQTPKVGARCGNTARRDLCGGRVVTRVPTAIGRGEDDGGHGVNASALRAQGPDARIKLR